MDLVRFLSAVSLITLWLFSGAVLGEEAKPDTTQQEPSQQDLFPPEQIEQLAAPIALYPDALLAQLLMAATYPLDIVQAARWQADNENLEGEALEKAAQEESWDPSVMALIFFPDVLAYMNDNLDWTQDLGDAVLAQQEDVMDAVQRLRKDAQDAGNLETTEQQRVETTDETIIVQPADPEVVYVPSYDPSNVYGQTEPPATTYYPTTYTTPAYSAPSDTDSLIGFGVGALAGGLLTAAIMWDNDDDRIYYGGPGYYGRRGYWNSPNYWSGGWRRADDIRIDRDVNIEGDINVNRGIVGNDINKWEHNPERRGGIRYRNERTQQKFANVRKEQHLDRDAARGRDPDRRKLANVKRPEAPAVKRPAAKRPAAQRPQNRAVTRPQSRPAKVRPPKRSTQRVAAPKKRMSARRDGGQASAFKVKRGASSRAASRRGAASRGGGRARHRGGGGGRRRHG